MTDAGHMRSPGAADAANWGWFVAIGVLLITLGVIALANLVAATVASIYYVGAIIIIAGVAHIVLAFRLQRWGRLFLWLLGGVAYTAAGILAFVNPLLASAVLTLVLAFALVFAGGLRLSAGFAARPEKGWGWIAAGGAITVLAGLVIATGWPVNSLWVLGLFLAVDLVIQGWSCIALGAMTRAQD